MHSRIRDNLLMELAEFDFFEYYYMDDLKNAWANENFDKVDELLCTALDEMIGVKEAMKYGRAKKRKK